MRRLPAQADGKKACCIFPVPPLSYLEPRKPATSHCCPSSAQYPLEILSRLVVDQGKEAANFQLSLSIYLIASALLVLLVIGLFLVIALLVFALIVIVAAACHTSTGRRYRYPFTIRFIQ